MGRKFLLEVTKLIKYATIKDEKSSSTAGGTFTSGSYLQRDLNTLDDPDTIGITLSADRFTLPAGEYFIRISAPAFDVQRHKAKLVRDPGGTPSDEIIGSSNVHINGQDFNHVFVSGRVSVAVAVDFEVQHRCTLTQAADGFGSPTTYGDVEVYTQVEILKV